jgi:hypothetical protein
MDMNKKQISALAAVPGGEDAALSIFDKVTS